MRTILKKKEKEPFYEAKIYSVHVSGSFDIEISQPPKTITMTEEKGEGIERQKEGDE